MSARRLKNTTDFNSFKVFEDIYGYEKKSPAYASDYSELDTPQSKNGHSFFIFTLVIFIIVVIGLSVHPLLAYFLKTPYPLVIITENALVPVLNRNDLILVQGIISQSNINLGDLVVYNPLPRKSNGNLDKLVVRKVASVNGSMILLEPSPALNMNKIYAGQVIGKVVGAGNPIKIPLIGKLASITW